ncbi:MAG: ABC transporter ATP-binding protein/permease [Clostridia bacterium]|nr:ABC transporter ATP-binding protein/permease [Clostridia bacterium]
MLQLKEITKQYVTGDTTVHALRGVSLEFRKSEFVSILGQSGCGKTTLLNIIGGLDQYTSGDLIIRGKSTKEFKDRDWDTYRNHSIGFIFQSYNLIPHQTVLQNVELALTISGVSSKERKRRAIEALETVGLGDQINKKPNQMSGGQMQRVAIARALVNDPDILLADEPTGALDSETSVQVMELLKEISRDKLVVMVTHNPDLAKEYSTRIINLLDGNVISDSNPYCSATEGRNQAFVDPAVIKDGKEIRGSKKHDRAKSKKKMASMSFFTALALSLNNLLTKKGRTFLTSFAGSIGIIGIALILSVSTGVNVYINSVEESTMASYPVQINESSMDTMTLLGSFMGGSERDEYDKDTIYSSDIMIKVMNAFSTGMTKNNLEKLKDYIIGIEKDEDGNIIDKETVIESNSTDIKYTYDATLNAFTIIKGDDGKVVGSFENLDGLGDLMNELDLGAMFGGSASSMDMIGGNAWSELVGDRDYIEGQYQLVDGRFPTEDGQENEVVLIVDKNNQVSDFILYILGIRNIQELHSWVADQKDESKSEDEKYKIPEAQYSTSDLLGYEFMVLPESEKYTLDENGHIIKRADLTDFVVSEDSTAMKVKIVGIVKPNDDSAVIGSIGYTSALMSKVLDLSNNSPVVKAQEKNKTHSLISGLPFEKEEPDMTYIDAMLSANQQVAPYVDQMTTAQKMNIIKASLGDAFSAVLDNAPYGGFSAAQLPMLKMFTSQIFPYESDENLLKIMNYMLDNQTYDEVMSEIGYINLDKPKAILIYPKDFDAKEVINNEITAYNDAQTDKADKITYSDTVAALMSSVTTIVDAITYVLVAFVSISLIVSSIMIGIITYISVLERTKEIGILRAIGASKKDISRVFNAETLIVGFIAGMIGIGATLLLNIVINVILYSLTGIATLQAALDPVSAVVLVLISMGLTLIAGLVPSSMASKKDPVIALRTE